MVEPKRSEKGKKSGFFRGMLDGLRSTVGQPSTAAGVKAILDAEVEELLKPSNFTVKTVVRHGFPYQPTAIAFDPVQRLIAIGTKNGSLRILGRPGVDISVRHVTEFAVIQIAFIINEGQLITICADDSIHMWNLRSKKLEIQQTLKFTKERITYCHLSFQSKWLYLGTERGNTYVVNIDTFSLSGYVINWNKAIELSRKTHPGCIFHLSDCPIDSNKLLIGYESGSIVLWDLRNKCADFRYAYTEGIQSMSWHSEGRQFICSHNDGSISTWNVKAGTKPSTIYPHSKMIATDHRPEPCNPIPKVEWRTVRNSDAYIIFSGGMPMESNGNNSLQMLTVIHGKSTTVLEMEHDIVDFITLCDSPYEADYSDPYAIVVLLDNDLVVVDLQTPGYPCFQNPYPMDLHESPVTYCYYLANCPPDLIRAFFMVGHKQTKRSGFSEREWPINGGEWGNFAVSYPEIIITGHADGSVKFWDATGVNLQVLYRMKTAKLFEKPKLSQQSASMSNAMETFEDLFAIEYICFVPETRSLCLAGASSQVITFRFVKTETSTELNVLVVPMNYDDFDPTSQSDLEIQSGMQSLLNQPPDPQDTSAIALRVKMGHHKRIAGFQPELVCISPWIDRRTPPYRITSMTHNVHANLLAYGTENSMVIIDLIQKSIVLNVPTSSLYGPSDPYQRISAKPTKRCTSAGPYSKELDSCDVDRCRSPVTESNNSDGSDSTIQDIIDSLQSDLAEYRLNFEDNDDHSNVIPISDIIDYNNDTDSNCDSRPIPPPRIKRRTKVNVIVKTLDTEHINSNESLTSNMTDNSSISSQNDLETKTDNDLKQSTAIMDPIDVAMERLERNQCLEKETCDNIVVSHQDHQPPTIRKDSDQSQTIGNMVGDERFRTIKRKFIDLRNDDQQSELVSPTVVGKLFNKLDSFARSRSSSMSSLENVGNESILFIAFANTFIAKNDTNPNPTVWVGTSCGSVIVIALTMPDNVDNRVLCLQTVLATPTPSIYRLKGSILNIGFLDSFGQQLSLKPDHWKDQTRADSSTPTSDGKRQTSLSITRSGSASAGGGTGVGSFSNNSGSSNLKSSTSGDGVGGSGSGGGASGSNSNSGKISKISPTTSSSDFRDSHLVVITSEKQIRLIALPLQVCVQKATITETSFAVRADVVYMKNQGESRDQTALCLACYLGTGNIVVYSLPSLRQLIDVDFVPLTDVRIARTIFFSANGHAMYMSSPSEVTKFTISSSIMETLSEMTGSAFTESKPLPEQPKQSFLKGLFGGAPTPLDREELFGEASSGKASKTTARLIPGSIDHAKAHTSAIGGEFAKLREGFNERGERLGKLEDSTARMQNEAEVFSSAAHAVMLKYRDKKWYQF